ncbi:hypothetical protein BGZ49_000397 [Haplosporangium sp. Z 27]|nr:hypothetical protein BGZ49_000397 [Haplosporangium sp. Z 27]
MSTVRKHANNVRSIHVRLYVADFPLQYFNYLQEIDIEEEFSAADALEFALDLIRRNQEIRKITFHSRKVTAFRKLVKLALNCPNLKVLNLYAGIKLDQKLTTQILDIGTRLQGLLIDAKEINFPESMDNWTQFPLMTSLGFKENFGNSLIQQLQVIGKCPRLRRLSWINKEYSLPIPDLCQVVSTECRKFAELELSPNQHIADEKLAQLITGSSNLTALSVLSSRSGLLSIQALSRHFNTLTRLEVNFESPFIQRIMTSCSQLLELKAPFLDVLDILGAVKKSGEYDPHKYGLHPQDWVCLNLRRLDIFIQIPGHKDDSSQRPVFHQLSRLKRLEELRIGGHDNELSWSRDGLDLRLECGLNILADLKRLKQFDYNDLYQQMSVQDAQWIVQEWPELRRFIGRSNANKEKRQQIESIMAKSGISCYF